MHIVSPEMFLRNAKRDANTSAVTNGLVRTDKILGKRANSIKAGVKHMKRIIIAYDKGQNESGKKQMTNATVKNHLQVQPNDVQST